ncbi:uncharacterized protein LOC110053784 [Orbicella faveolata]|uniref:uncharacterized protein LOC110053784 n=1 Tax=Orbicella faveolata TaxID=48498 RepID=UPI0009E315EE|nr:uncharacterized protein LOC110053784 [Orbicella faveolata]
MKYKELTQNKATKMVDNLRMDTVELLNQIGVLAFINGGEEGKALYNAFVTGRVCYEVYKRLSVSQADVLRAETIMRISEYVKSHPRASEAQLKAEVEKEIKLFAQKIAELEAIH